MTVTRILGLLLVVGTLSTLLHRYLWLRLVRDAHWPDPWGKVATIVLVVLAIATPLTMLASRSLPRELAKPLAYLMFTWMGVFFLLFVSLVTADLVRLFVQIASLALPERVDPARRLWIARAVSAGSALVAVTVGGIGVAHVLRPVAVKKLRVALGRLPKDLEGLRIVQLSDVHIGPTLGRSWLVDVVRQVNALQPDLVVITGDLVDGTVNELREHTKPLADLRSTYGTYFVTGNHEYYSGADAWIAELTHLGIRVLRNERVEIRRGEGVLDLAGVDDHSAHQFGLGHGADIERAVAGRDVTRELVLLAHQPKQALGMREFGVGLQLSGHTHGGQIWPFNYLVKLQQPWVAGLVRRGETQIYISSGTGYWGPPMRVAAPAEITELTLVCT